MQEMLEKVLTKIGAHRQMATKAKSVGGALHTTSQVQYPSAPALKMPSNIDQYESAKFSPERFREVNAISILNHPSNCMQSSQLVNQIDVTVDSSACPSYDAHLAAYDCANTVSLNCSMQSNVPEPYGGLHNHAIALAMPGGGYANLDKLYAGQVMQDSHYTELKKELRKDWHNYEEKPTTNH